MAVSREDYEAAKDIAQQTVGVDLTTGMRSGPSEAAKAQAQATIRAYLSEQNANRMGGQAQGSDDLAAKAEADWQEMRDLTIGEKQRVMDDPMLAEAMRYYQQQMGGVLSDEMIGRMQAQAEADSYGRAEMERRGMRRQMSRQNLRPGDPGYQSAMRDVYLEDLRRRQGARNELAIRQALENQRYGSQGARNLTSARMAQLGLAGQYGLQGAQYLSQRSYEDPNNAAQLQIPVVNYGGYQPTQMPALPDTQTQVTQNRTGVQRTPIEHSADPSDPNYNARYHMQQQAEAAMAYTNAQQGGTTYSGAVNTGGRTPTHEVGHSVGTVGMNPTAQQYATAANYYGYGHETMHGTPSTQYMYQEDPMGWTIYDSDVVQSAGYEPRPSSPRF